ncbi:hypothetical protein [Rhodococcus cercidiphylli]|uniref:hypothetical protein n=1 Tax=Rhodococcus cercidiphylli TaxID=489916 RepID=UPI00374EE751
MANLGSTADGGLLAHWLGGSVKFLDGHCFFASLPSRKRRREETMTQLLGTIAHGSEQHRLIAEENTVMRGQVGSGLHGVTIVGRDDRDDMGLCIEPPEYVIGNEKFEQYQFRIQPEGVGSGVGDLDLVVY